MKGYEENIPIGKPLSNIKLYVVDRNGRRVPVGAAGELWVAGRQVSLGYLNRPEQTAKAYIPNPFCTAPTYGRVYRTGDVVGYRADGNIEFIGLQGQSGEDPRIPHRAYRSGSHHKGVPRYRGRYCRILRRSGRAASS